jgi:hypothetical protein
VAYSVLAEGRNEEEADQLDIAIGMAEDPSEAAILALRAHQEAAGITFEDAEAPVPPDDKTLYGEGDVPWQT